MQVSDATLARLMAQAQRGDADAYRGVLEASKIWLERYFARRIAPAVLDDLVQETLVALHRKRATYDPARPFLPWLAAIARYRWIDELRRTYRAGVQDSEAEPVDPGFESIVMAGISLSRLFERLPAKQADAIRLVKIQGYSVAEAAAQTRQSESLVKVNIHRGLRKLAQDVESN